MVPQRLGFRGSLKGVRGLAVGRDGITAPQTSTSIQEKREIKTFCSLDWYVFTTSAEAGTPGASREWIDAECQLAINHLIEVCGEPPPEMDLEVQRQEHDLGGYSTIVLI